MSFTGKATYSAGSTLPEIAEDVADIIGIVSPFETPLLDHLGDAPRSASSTVHEWLEDELLPNTDLINDSTYSNPTTDTSFVVDHGDRFRIGDQIQIQGSREVMFVTGVSTNTLTVVRGYGGTINEDLADGAVLRILGNAALEGDDRPTPRFTNRQRQQNYTQIFTAGVEVSGSQLAAAQLALADELDYQKQERLRELLRDLENCVLNGVAADSSPQGSSTVRRTMRGIIPSLVTNILNPGSGTFPAGEGEDDLLTEEQINAALRQIWEQSAARVDTIVVNGFQKRRINGFITSSRGYNARDTRFRDLVSVYESDFGVCRVLLSRWMPQDSVLLLDSSRIDVLPLSGRSFQFKKLAATGDSESGMVLGEYTVEVRNENAHGLIHSLGTA
ncbi:MAG: DUF5309 family protein [Phycisphaeraceae bacterium]